MTTEKKEQWLGFSTHDTCRICLLLFDTIDKRREHERASLAQLFAKESVIVRRAGK